MAFRGVLFLVAVCCSALALTSPVHADLRSCDQWVKTTSAGPSPRYGQAMVWDSARGKAILFGGLGLVGGAEAPFDDTWEYDPVSSTWAEISTIGRPSPRFHHAMTYDTVRARVVMFGGQNDPDGDDPEDFHDEVWEYDPVARTWTQPVEGGFPPFRRAGCRLAYDPVRQVSVLFGGHSTNGAVENEAREWNGSSWRSVNTPHTPDERTGHAMVYSGAFGGVVMFGGVTATDSQFEFIFEDAWRYDGSDWTELPNSYEEGITNHVMATGPNGVDLVVFGGQVTGSNLDDDTILRTSSTATWNVVRTAGPPPLDDASAVSDAEHGRVIMFGGGTPGDGNSRVPSGDTWELRGLKPVLGPIGPAADTIATPCVTNSFAAPLLAPELGPFEYGWRRRRDGDWEYLFDHGHVSGTRTNVLQFAPLRADDAGIYDVVVSNACGATASAEAAGSGAFRVRLADGHWVPGKFLPAARHSFAMGYDSDRATMVIHGGMNLNVDFSYAFHTGTWESVAGGNWEFAADAGPSARAFHAMAYDPERHRMVMFGGHWQDQPPPGPGPIPTETFAETWEYDGTTWTQKHPVQNPGARSRHAMTWDPVRKRVVLFGGFVPGGSVAAPAMWEWDGSNWTLRPGTGDDTIGPAGTALGFPPGRDQTGFAYDTKRGALMVHGGSFYLGLGSSPNIKHGDTWEQIGGQWRRRSVVTDYARATGGEHRAMAYDVKHDATLLFTNSQSLLNDELGILWGWKPATAEWEEKPGRIPIYREKAAMAYDAGRERVVLAGGYRGCYGLGGGPKICDLDDTWEWEFFDFDPTCGVDACGDGYLDSSESCDPGRGLGCCTADCHRQSTGGDCSEYCAGGTCDVDGGCRCPDACGNGRRDLGEDCDPGNPTSVCCNSNCTFATGTLCNDVCPGDGVCIGGGSCQCLPTCGDGFVEWTEECDPPGDCCTPKCRYDGPGAACGDVCRGDVCLSVPGGTCAPGNEDPTGCSAATSAKGFVEFATGGTVATPDGAFTLLVPGSAASSTYGIAGGLATSAFGVGTPQTRVLTARLMPAGRTFPPPGAVLVMRWPDADGNGVVDGTTVNEGDLRFYKDGVPLAGPCSVMPPCASPTSEYCCDVMSNRMQVELSSFSEVVLVEGAPCAVASSAKLSLTKMLPPAGDDGLAFAAVLPAPSTPPDPDVAGLGIVVNDATRALVNVTLPAGAYDKAAKTGWKVDKKRTKWKWTHPKDGGYGGLVQVTLALNAKKGELKVGVKGAKGDYAATPPVTLALRFPGTEACARAALAEASRTCAVKAKGKTLVCK